MKRKLRALDELTGALLAATSDTSGTRSFSRFGVVDGHNAELVLRKEQPTNAPRIYHRTSHLN
jgi:hypothetical protein